jgi:hypothetical protein
MSELDSLLNALEGEAASGDGCSEGYVLASLQHAGIGRPVPVFATVKIKNKYVKRETAESLKALAAWKATKIPVIDRNSPLAAQLWEQRSIALHEEYERSRLANAPKVAPTPKEAAPFSMRVVRI